MGTVGAGNILTSKNNLRALVGTDFEQILNVVENIESTLQEYEATLRDIWDLLPNKKDTGGILREMVYRDAHKFVGDAIGVAKAAQSTLSTQSKVKPDPVNIVLDDKDIPPDRGHRLGKEGDFVPVGTVARVRRSWPKEPSGNPYGKLVLIMYAYEKPDNRGYWISRFEHCGQYYPALASDLEPVDEFSQVQTGTKVRVGEW